MKIRLLLLNILISSAFNVILAGTPSYIQTNNGVIVFTDPVFTGTSNPVKLEVVSDNIISVSAAPEKEIVPVQSLITVLNKRSNPAFSIVTSKDKLTLKTKELSAVGYLKTGIISFWDSKGKKILSGKPIAGRSFKAAVFDGKRYYHLTQTFQTTADDLWNRLGQYRDVIMIYQGQQITFFKKNTGVAIPFLISGKNYSSEKLVDTITQYLWWSECFFQPVQR